MADARPPIAGYTVLVHCVCGKPIAVFALESGSDFDQCVAHVLEHKLQGKTVALKDAKGAVPCGFDAPTCALHNLYPLSEAMRRLLTDNQMASMECMVLPEEGLDEARRLNLRSAAPEAPAAARSAAATRKQAWPDSEMEQSCGLWQRFSLELTRAEYEGKCSALFDRGVTPVSRLLEYLDLTVEEIDEVVMVGGMTRTPRVRELLQSHLGVSRLNVEIDPDVVVAYGAATIAH